MVLFRQKYRIESTRLKGWDYSDSGYYFVILCTKDRVCYFGRILNSQVILSDVGQIVSEERQEIEEKRDNVKLDSWIIMPNHIHGIIVITKKCEYPVETSRRDVSKKKKIETQFVGIDYRAI